MYLYDDIRSSSDQELLAMVVNEGSAASDLMKLVDSLPNLIATTLEELKCIRGIGPKRAMQIRAALELGRRAYTIPPLQKLRITTPDGAASLVMPEMQHYDREHFRVLYLDRKGGLICMEDISVGGLHSSVVHPREIFKVAVKRSAASLILVHNHPSGDPSPSLEDLAVTKQIQQAGEVMGIRVLDHIIIGAGDFFSIKARDLL